MNTKKFQTKLIIHGGAGKMAGTPKHLQEISRALTTIGESSFSVLNIHGARSAVLNAVKMLEDNPLFNAGTGSRLQDDGKIRMSASLMDSSTGIFSAVINVQNIRNPIDVAELLSREKHTVLAGDKATEYCRLQGVDLYNPVTDLRKAEYDEHCVGRYGTVGAVALDQEGVIVAGTSTGGIGCEIPGRVSDSATVAGNYAVDVAGVSCTGIGEEIVNDAVAVRVVIRIQDGMSLRQAVKKTLAEAKESGKRYGLIAVDKLGNIDYGYSTEGMYYAFHDGQNLSTFLDSD